MRNGLHPRGPRVCGYPSPATYPTNHPRPHTQTELQTQRGFPAALPAALVEQAGLRAQRVVCGTVDTLAAAARDAGAKAPATLVVGRAVRALDR